MANVRDQRPISSARFIGRVGGLAVALGIGIAVASNPVVALAETGDGSSSSAGGAGHESSKSKAKQPTGAKAAAASDSGAQAKPTKSKARTNSKKSPAAQAAVTPTKIADVGHKAAVSAATVAVADKGVSASATVSDTTTAVTPNRSSAPVAVATASVSASTTSTSTSVLANATQLAAEKKAKQIVSTLPMQLMKLLVGIGFALEGQYQFRGAGGLNAQNLAQLGNAVDEYAQQAAMEYQLLDPMKPTVLQMVMPPHSWMGQNVTGTRILYDNPDTIYRMMAVNATSSYVISGKFAPGATPADTSFSVLTGLGGNTAAVLNAKNMQINPDGSFTITVSKKPAAAGELNHLQIPTDATLIVARNTLSDWNTQQPMSLSIDRVSGPKDSLFAQIGGFDIPKLGSMVAGNQFLTNLVSIIPPLPYMPPVLQGLETAVVMALGLVMEPQYMAVATHNGNKAPNVFTDPSSNATFLATQLQSAGYFQLKNDQALVLTINPGSAGYFVVPVTNDWTITTNYWDQQTSLNIAQSVANPDGTYTIVVSKTDPGVANWVSTGGLNQGTISIRFQNIDTSQTDTPKVSSQVVAIDELDGVLPVGTTYVTAAERAAAIAQRKAGYESRFAPYPQS